MELSLEQANALVTPYFPGLMGLEFTEVSQGRTVCRVDVSERMLNPGGVLHGGVHHSLADTGMAIALLTTLDDGQLFTTIEIKVSYFEAVVEGPVICTTQIVKRGKRIAFLESELLNNGRVAARATGTYYIR